MYKKMKFNLPRGNISKNYLLDLVYKMSDIIIEEYIEFCLKCHFYSL